MPNIRSRELLITVSQKRFTLMIRMKTELNCIGISRANCGRKNPTAPLICTRFILILPIFFRTSLFSFRIKVYTVPGQPVHEAPRQYLNRLSDLLFVLARVLNRANLDGLGGDDVYWRSERLARAAD